MLRTYFNKLCDSRVKNYHYSGEFNFSPSARLFETVGCYGPRMFAIDTDDTLVQKRKQEADEEEARKKASRDLGLDGRNRTLSCYYQT
jgi:hypothetical protein